MKVIGFVCGILLWVVAVSDARAQTVQLPSRQVFSVNTSVLVPDRGGAYLGGVRRSSQGVTQRGPLRNRSLGGATSAGGASVHATVIDLRELDRLVLAEGAARRAARESGSIAKSERRLPPATARRFESVAARDALNQVLTFQEHAQRTPMQVR
jgi:hypothetical protein